MEQPSALRSYHNWQLKLGGKKKVVFIRKVLGYKEKHEAAISVMFGGIFI